MGAPALKPQHPQSWVGGHGLGAGKAELAAAGQAVWAGVFLETRLLPVRRERQEARCPQGWSQEGFTGRLGGRIRSLIQST